MHPYLDEVDGNDFTTRDTPSPAFIAAMSARYPTERETDALYVRKMQRRSGPPYQRMTLDELKACLDGLLGAHLTGAYEVSDCGWFTGGVSKIQMGFTLAWTDPVEGPKRERLVIRMDPNEGSNTTSREREWDLLRAFEGVIPVPKVYWIDREGKWFPEPALVYAFVPGVTKPRTTATGRVSGLGTNFGPELRQKLAPQFLKHLAAIHTFDPASTPLPSMDVPRPGTTDSGLWQLNRARRVWEEDRGEDVPLVEVACNWLERNLPVTDHVGVVHGDFRSGNFLFDEATGRIDAWLDWERGHLGDRHRDLAWMTDLTMGHYGEDGTTYYVCGLIPQHDFFRLYEEASGLTIDPERLAWYRILNSVQILGSVIATGYRVARLGKSHQDILLTRVKGMAPTVMAQLSRLLRERL